MPSQTTNENFKKDPKKQVFTYPRQNTLEISPLKNKIEIEMNTENMNLYKNFNEEIEIKENFNFVNQSLPLTQSFSICFHKIIERQYFLTNKAVMKVIFEKYAYLDILQFFKR